MGTWKISDKANLTQGNIAGSEEVVIDTGVRYNALTISAINSFADVVVQTLSANKTLVATDPTIQILDPNGSRSVILPPVSLSTKLKFTIINNSNGTDETITVKNSTGTNIVTLDVGDSAIVYCDGSNWYYSKFLSESNIEESDTVIDNDPDDGSYSGETTKGIAGENLAFGDLLYGKSVAAKGLRWYKYSASPSASDKNMISRSMSTEAVSAEGEFTMLLSGTIKKSGWGFTQYQDEGKLLYASMTPGMVTTVAPTASQSILQVIGDMYEVNIVHFAPSRTWIEND